MRTENSAAAGGHFIQLFDEDGSRLPQFIDHMLVVDNFLADVDRRAVKVECNLDHIDGPDDTGAEAARLEQKDLLLRAEVRCERL